MQLRRWSTLAFVAVLIVASCVFPALVVPKAKATEPADLAGALNMLALEVRSMRAEAAARDAERDRRDQDRETAHVIALQQLTDAVAAIERRR